jgi:hypothetical protein
MMAEWLLQVMVRDLRGLAKQIEAYEDESDIWKLAPGIDNSAGTLALHLAGNLQHYIGARLGGSDYVRDREAEFGDRDVPRSVLLEQIAAAESALETGLAGLDDGDLSAEYPEKLGGVNLTTGVFLVHLAAHLGYHLGQLDYHRRRVTGNGAVAGMLSPKLIGDR